MLRVPRSSRVRERLNWACFSFILFAVTILYNGQGYYEIKVVLKQEILKEIKKTQNSSHLKGAEEKGKLFETRNDEKPIISKIILKKLPPAAVNELEWMECNELERIYIKCKNDKQATFRNMNKHGNKAVYFATVYNRSRRKVHIALKVAVVFDSESESDAYRYRSALREITNLRKMASLGWNGIPALLGACVTSHKIIYAVERIQGMPLCGGNGTDTACAMSHNLTNFMQFKQAAAPLLWLSKVTCFFRQFEENRAFMEDVSGSNFYYDPKSFDIYIVDADSVIFYDKSILGGTSCRSDAECAHPLGNLWGPNALNHKIYFTCREARGFCHSNKCWGIDASLHNCGVSRWLISPLRTLIDPRAYTTFREIMHCLMAKFPQKRCTMTDSCAKAERLYKDFNQAHDT